MPLAIATRHRAAEAPSGLPASCGRADGTSREPAPSASRPCPTTRPPRAAGRGRRRPTDRRQPATPAHAGERFVAGSVAPASRASRTDEKNGAPSSSHGPQSGRAGAGAAAGRARRRRSPHDRTSRPPSEACRSHARVIGDCRGDPAPAAPPSLRADDNPADDGVAGRHVRRRWPASPRTSTDTGRRRSRCCTG